MFFKTDCSWKKRAEVCQYSIDLMFFPEGSDFTIQDIIDNQKYIKPQSQFRTDFRYNNNMYIVAGEVLKRVSGMSWEDFIETRIMRPVGMVNSKASYNRVTDKSNIIEAHTRTEGKVIQIPHDFLLEEVAKLGISLPEAGEYGVGMTFFPSDPQQTEACRKVLNANIEELELSLLGGIWPRQKSWKQWTEERLKTKN